MRAGWWAFVLLIVAGCSLDELGLAPFGPGGGIDSSLPDSGSNDDGSIDDATIDVVTANDAPDDSTTSTDAGADTGSTDAGVDTGTADAGVDAGPIITITGGNYTLDGVDAGVCSSGSSSSINFQLQNQHGTSVDLIWVNFSCNEQVYATVASGGSASQQTYVNHIWRVRNSSNQAFLAEFILTQQATYTVTIH